MVSSTCAFSLPVEKYRKPSGVGIFRLSLNMFEIMVAGTAKPIFLLYGEALSQTKQKQQQES